MRFLCFCLLPHFFARGFGLLPVILIPSVVSSAGLDGEEEFAHVGEEELYAESGTQPQFLRQSNGDIFYQNHQEEEPSKVDEGGTYNQKKRHEQIFDTRHEHYIEEHPRETDDKIAEHYEYTLRQSVEDEDQFSLSLWNNKEDSESVDLHRKRWMSETKIIVDGDLKTPEPVFFELESRRGVGSCRLKIKRSSSEDLKWKDAGFNLSLQFLHCTYIRDEEPVTMELENNLVVITSSTRHKESLRKLKNAIGGRRQLYRSSGVIGNCMKNGGKVPCPSFWNDCWNKRLRKGTYQRIRIFVATDRGYCDRFETKMECGEDAIGVIDDANTIYRNQLGVDLFPSIIFTDIFGTLDMRPEVVGKRSCSVESVEARLLMMRTYRINNYFYRNSKPYLSKADRRKLDNSDFGIFHLLTDCYPPSGIVGMALTQQLCNSNAVSLSTYTETRWLTFAHEVGHNFGSHDAFTAKHEEGKVGGIMDYGDGTFYDPKRRRSIFQFHPKHQKEMCKYMRSRRTPPIQDVPTRCFELVSAIQLYPDPAPLPKQVDPSEYGIFIAKIILICITVIGAGSALLYAMYLIYRRCRNATGIVFEDFNNLSFYTSPPELKKTDSSQTINDQV